MNENPTPFLCGEHKPLNRTFDHTAASVGLRGRARASVGVNADDTSIATVRAISMLRGIAVTLSNRALTTNVNAVGA